MPQSSAAWSCSKRRSASTSVCCRPPTKDHAAASTQLERARVRFVENDCVASSSVEAQRGVDSYKWAKAEVDTARDAVVAAKLARDDAEKAERDTHQQKTQSALSRLHEAERKVAAAASRISAECAAETRAAKDALNHARQLYTQAERLRQQAESARAHDVSQRKRALEQHRARTVILAKVPCGGSGSYSACGLIADAKESERAIPVVLVEIDALTKQPIDAIVTTDGGWDLPPTKEEIEEAAAALKKAEAAEKTPITVVEQVDVDAARQAIGYFGAGATAAKERAAHEESLAALERAQAEAGQLAVGLAGSAATVGGGGGRTAAPTGGHRRRD